MSIADKYLLSARKYPETYTPQVIRNVKLMSFSEDHATPFGSYIYKIQKYPSDIDLVEIFEECCTIKQVAEKFTKKLQKIVKNIVRLRLHYLTEAKIGEDDRYDLPIGYLDRGIYYIDQQTKENLLDIVANYVNEGLMSHDDFLVVNEIVEKDYNTTSDYDILYNLLRDYRVIRWTNEEILRGKKELPGGIKLTLPKALSMKGHVKLDMITDINGKLTEITNFLFLIKEGLDNKKYIINLAEKYDEELLLKRAETELPKEIERLLYSPYYYNPFKAIKRLWALARHYKDYSMINKLKSFISGNISLLYQLKSEIGNILLVMKKLKSLPIATINKQIQDIKSRLTYVLEIGDEEGILDNMLNIATNADRQAKFQILNNVEKILIRYINYFTVEFMNSNNLNRISYPYIPREPQYSTNYILPYDTQKGDEAEIESLSLGLGCLECGAY